MKKVSKKRNPLTQRVQTIQNNLRKNGLKVSMSEIREWFKEEWDNKNTRICPICDEVMGDIEEVSLDHKQPTSRGGQPGLDNCAIVHKECNSIKGDFTIEEIRYLIESVNSEAWEILKNRLKRSTLIFGRR